MSVKEITIYRNYLIIFTHMIDAVLKENSPLYDDVHKS